MAELLYFGSHISENILTDKATGFITCLNVPVARTGWQVYEGRELGADFCKLHNIRPDERIKVYRAAEEVFSPETMASFEGDPVTDNHPPGGRFVNSENFRELVCGHGQNLRRGEEQQEGEELLADLCIQYKPLVNDVLTEVKREVSCGYDYKLRLRSDGHFEQYEIRGNHIAIVSKGRAGDKVRINDSAPPDEKEESIMPETTAPAKPAGLTWRNFLMGLGLKHYATDAKPEEVAEAQDALQKEGEMPEATKRLSEDELKAKDAELTEREKKVQEAEDGLKRREEDSKKRSDDKRTDDRRADDAHVEGCRCTDCMDKAKDRRTDDAKATDARFSRLMDAMENFFEKAKSEKKEETADKRSDDDDPDDKMEKIKPADNPAEDKTADKKAGDKKKVADKKKADDGLDPIPPVTAKEETHNPIPGADAAIDAMKDFLRSTKADVAKSGDSKKIELWNRACDAVQDPRSATTRGGYDAFTDLKRAVDADPESLSVEDRLKQYQSNLDKSNSRAQGREK